MTWGQIRLALTKQLPGVDLELLTGWIQASYDVILNERVWAGLSGSGVLVTVAPITAGTVTVTNGSDQVAGAGTAFDFNVAGRLFTVGDDIWYAVLGYADATHLTLDRAFTGPTAATATYRIIQDSYPLAESVHRITQMTAGVAGLILRRYGPGDLFTEDPGRRVSGFPTRWAHDDDTAEFGSGAPVFHQVRLQPVPDGVYTLDYTYERAPLGFSGSNVADTPLSWVHADAIIQGALLRALSSPYFADMKGADRLARSAAALQQVALTPMRRADNAKKGPHALVLASDSRYVSND